MSPTGYTHGMRFGGSTDATNSYDDGILRAARGPGVAPGFKQSLNYPLKNDNNYKAKLTFQVVDEEKHRTVFGENLKKEFMKPIQAAGGFVKGVGDVIGTVFNVKSSKDAVRELNGLGKTTSAAVKTGHVLTVARDFPRINLYLPQAINIQDAASYDNTTQLGRIGEIIRDKLPEGDKGGPAGMGAAQMGRAAGQSAGGIGLALAGGNMNNEVSNIISQNLLKKVNEGASNAVALQTQTTLNPNVRTLFRSVPIRQFAFSFTLIATSLAESKEIENIIQAFRTELYPEKLNVGGTSYGYRYPRRFLLKASYKNKEWPGVKFLPTYLTSFNAIYNPNGMGFHKDGNWTEVTVSMNFSESRALGRQDIEVGY